MFGGCRPDRHSLLFWLLLQAATPPTVLNYFLGDTKAVLKGCEDHWTLQDRTSLPQLNQMTVCVDIRVVVPGAWVAFSYSSIYAPKPELGLEGDEKAVYAWLLRVRHRFPIKLKPTQWHRLCLRRDAHKNSFSLELEGRTVAERSVYSQAIPASGSLWLGCRPRDQPPGRVMAEVELYLFRMWAGTGNYAPCEDGTVIGWDSEYWGVTSPKASQTDEELPCDPRPSRLCKDELRTKPVGLRPRPDWRLSDDSSHRGWRPQPRRRFRGDSNWRGWPDRRSNNVLPNRPGPHWRSPNTGLRPGTGWRSSNTGLRPGTGWRSSNTGPRSARGGSVTNIFISANAVSSVGAVPLPAPRIAKDAKQQKETNKEGSSSATCKVSPLQYCSSNDTYFWMVLNVQTQKNNIENEAKKLVSDTFSCTHNKTAVFCQGGKKIKVKPVSCGQHQSSGNANCSMILSFSHAVSPCDLLGGRDSKLLQDANSSTKATIVGVERVGKCEDKNPADKFCHRLTTTLEQTCPSSAQDTFNCTIIDLESMTQVPRLPDSCSGGSSCTCSAFCNSTSQFFATKINVNNNSVNVNIIKALEVEVKCDNETKLSCLVVLEMSAAVNVCSLSQIMQQIFNTSGISVKESLRRMVLCGSAGSTREALLRSNWTWDSTQRQFSEVCTQDHDIKCATNESLAVFLYDNCSKATSPATTLTPRSDSTNYFVQTTFETTNGGSMTSSARQMEVTTALAATQPPVLPTTKPDAAVTPSHSTVGVTKSNTETILSHPGYPSSEMAGWSTPLYTDDSMFTQMTLEPITDAQISVLTTQNQPTTEQTNSTTTVESQQNNTTTTQPPAEAPEDQNTTTQNQPMTDTTNGTTAVPSQPRNTTETPDSTTANNTTSPNLLTQLTNATTTTQSGATDVQQVNSTTWSPSDTTVNNQTTVRPVSSSPNDTTRHETTTQTTHNTSDSTRTVSHETAFNTTTNEMTNTLQPGVTSAREQHNSTVTTTNTAVSQSSTNNVTDNVTTAPANNPTVNSTSVTNYSDNTTGNTAATGNTTTTASLTNNHTTAIPSHITRYNESTVTNEFTGDNNTFTPTTNNYTEEYSQTTGVNNYTTTFNTTSTASNYTTVLYRNTTTAYTTTSPNYTTNNTSRTANGYVTTDNNNTALHNYTTENNTTAVPKSYTTTTNNLTTTINNHTTMSNNLTTTINNHTTTSNNLTTMINNHTTTSNNLTTMINNHTTTSNNYTTNYNLTTASTINATTTPHNYTAFVNYTTTSNNYTTASTNHTTVFNLTTPSSANVTTSSNYTTTNPLTSISSNHTTVTMSNVTVVPPSTLLYNQTANNTTTSVTTPSATTDSGGNATTAAAHASKTTTSNVANMTTTGGALLPPTDTTTVEDTTTTTTTTTTTNNPTTAAADPTSTSVAQTTNSEQSLEALADDLLEQTKDVSKLDAAQVARLVKQLEKLLEGPSVSESLGQKVVQVVSNLVEADPAALSGSANRLIQIVDTVGIKLSLSGDRGVLSAESLVLAVRAVDGTNFPTTSVNIFGTNSVQLRALGRSRSKRSDSALGSVVLPPGLTDGLSPQQQQQANRVQFTYFSSTAFFQDETLDNTTMVSPVLGSSVANLSISNLTENVLFTIQNLQPVPENFTASCVFWDFSVNGDRGGWSSEGCSVVNSTAEATTCSCNHLTSFAILLDFPREEMIDPRHAQILTFITYIGCGVSAIFLAFTLLTYLLFDKLMRDIPAKILVQLCFSLLFLNLVFLLDGWLALYPAVGLCISTAFFLHYFLLTSFTWTGLEAVHMYLSIVQVFTPYLSRYMLKFSLVGWGFPLIVVIVIIAVNKDNYGLVTYGKYTDGTTDDFCWLRNDIAFYVGVVAYFLLIFSVCVVVFIIVMVQLARIKRQNPHNQAANRGVLADARSITGLVVLLGLTWGFALFAWGPLYIPFVYLFTICNSFQGFLIFVFHCAVKENVRRQWRTHLCCGRLRLAENSDWSRTATQSNRHPSMNTTNTSAPFSTSRSSSVSDSTTSGFALVDSGIYDNTTTDVVLNEAHRRALNLEREN